MKGDAPMSLRFITLIVLSVCLLLLCIGLIWFGLGEKTNQVVDALHPNLTPDYLAKREILKTFYYEARQKGVLQHPAMMTVRKMADDPDWNVRVRALSVLYYVRNPQQRREAIQIALERLKDTEWVVRNYALRVLAAQQAKECVPQILPLLNDPQPETREQAKKTLRKLGYKVGE
jgi:hypothetical protein